MKQWKARRSAHRKACPRKRGYPDRGGAERALAEMGLRPETRCPPGYSLASYQCEVCGLWHVGKRPDGRRLWGNKAG